MAITATLVEQGHNRLRYLLDCNTTGTTTLTITTTGGATPDLLTDSLYGPIKKCAQAFTNGIGLLPAGALTQAQSRAIWEADNSDVVLGNGKVARCLPRLNRRGGAANWTVDANVDGGGHPTMIVTADNTGQSYLDIQTQGAIGI
jgi:hypothetical protein